MSTTQIPPQDPPSASPPLPQDPAFYEARPWESYYGEFDDADFPHLLLQLQDDIARSRKREALWLSVIFHLTIVILIVNGPALGRWLPHGRVVAIAPRNLNDKDLTYLEMPPDIQKLTERPKTNIISDKDRMAMSKVPRPDPKELKKIIDSARAGTPGPSGATTPPQAGQQPSAPQMQASGAVPPMPQNQNPPQTSQMQAPPVNHAPPQQQAKVDFRSMMNNGSSVEAAARAAMQNRGASVGGGGEGGQYGLGPGGNSGKVLGNMEVLSDTMGVDFGPYLARVLDNVRRNWYLLIPESARAPIMKKGKLSIIFYIMKDGKVAGMQLFATSGDAALDRAAWGGITNSNPFPPLPREFAGQYLELRFNFYYNPDRGEVQ
jgi:outer membrane biosynthesis protein TonB